TCLMGECVDGVCVVTEVASTFAAAGSDGRGLAAAAPRTILARLAFACTHHAYTKGPDPWLHASIESSSLEPAAASAAIWPSAFSKKGHGSPSTGATPTSWRARSVPWGTKTAW